MHYTPLVFGLGDLTQYVPQSVSDVASFLLVLVLLIALVVAVLGVLSSLMDIAMYAVMAVIAIAGFFLIVDFVGLDGAVRIGQSFLDMLLGAVLN